MKRILTGILILLMLTSCSPSALLGVEDLLHPPKLTEEQTKIFEALQNDRGTSGIKLKYPRSGQFQSAFVLQDIDEDGQDEAIVFYELDSSKEALARINILDQQDGEWHSQYDVPGMGRNIDYVRFANLSEPNSNDIVIGWDNANAAEMTVSVYTYKNQVLNTIFDSNYSEILISDLDANGMDEMLLLSNNTVTGASRARLVKGSKGKVFTVSGVSLSRSYNGYLQMIAGSLPGKSVAIFIDGITETGEIGTEVLYLEEGNLVSAFKKDLQNSELLIGTLRPARLACSDVNGDGYIEIPSMSLLPGYEEAESKMYFTQYLTLEIGAVNQVSVAETNIVNQAEGYRLKFPESWVGQVTVSQQVETGEMRFFVYQGNLDDDSRELLRIRVYSEKDYQDQFAVENYRTIKTKGLFRYYAYIPPNTEEPLAINYAQLRELFTLLTE